MCFIFFKMGGFLGKAMDDNMQKNQEFMAENQRVMLERQMHMQNQMRERMVAMQIARTREMFAWLVSFYVIAGAGMIRGYDFQGLQNYCAHLKALGIHWLKSLQSWHHYCLSLLLWPTTGIWHTGQKWTVSRPRPRTFWCSKKTSWTIRLACQRSQLWM